VNCGVCPMIRLTAFVQRDARMFAKFGTFRLTRCNLLPLICNCLPIIDELCRCRVDFDKCSLSDQYNITRFLSLHAVFHARGFSPLGQNVAFRTSKYNLALYELLNLPIRLIIIAHLNQSTNAEIYRAASFVLD
jgi:hypothetical protein